MVKYLTRAAIPRWAITRVATLATKADPFLRLSWSQEGEDMILRRLFESRGPGFYVDVGAHDPFRFSNTCYFHRRGWRGINIDANPSAIEGFRKHRPLDVNLCFGIAESPGTLTLHRFDEPALDTFDPTLAAARSTMPGYRLVERVEVEVRRLDDVLAAHLPEGQEIDYLTVDVEGFDLQVLRSNEWTRFRPKVLLVEVRGTTIDALDGDPSYRFVCSVGYRAVAKTVNTVIFVEGDAA